jgi:ribonuclease HII
VIVAGVDEAGRGSVLGPLIVAGVSIDDFKIPQLVSLGVKDSKLLPAARRSYLFRKIKQLASEVRCEKILPKEIDRVVFNGEKFYRLNYLEAKTMASVLYKLKFDKAYIDCCDTNQTRFGQLVSDLVAEKQGITFSLGERNPFFEKIVSEHHADRNYAVVSAASIIAKVTRDSYVKRLRRKHGEFGSGYPSDPNTVSYLKKVYETSSKFPSITRLSWMTVRRLQGLTIEEETTKTLTLNEIAAADISLEI